MRIGLDLDNTIACYGEVFPALAQEAGLPPDVARAGKVAIRGYLREAGREDAWTEMQGVAYGLRMGLAQPYPGALEFISLAAASRNSVAIISHRTSAPYRGEACDLHDAARRWLESNGITVPVYLETTAEAKAARIAALGCEVFVDDLPEFLGRKDMSGVPRRILFDPESAAGQTACERTSSWADLQRLLFPQ